MSDLTIGYNEISNTGYHADTNYYSSSTFKMALKDINQFYRQYVLGEPSEFKESDSLTFGSYVHSLVLEPHLVDSEYVIFPKKRHGKEWEAFKEENAEKTIITRTQNQKALEVRDAVLSNEHAVELLRGEAEKTLCVELEGFKVKVRADLVNNNSIVDLKTCFYGCNESAAMTAIDKWGYALSAALYVDAFTAYTGKKHDFYFVFASTKEPFEAVPYKAGEDMLEFGRSEYKKAMSKIREARESGVWEEEKIKTLHLPSWMKK